MIAGRKYWILIWYGILLLGLLGLGGALFWGRQTHWRNLDEVFRGIGTITVSVGMLLLLYGVLTGVGQLLLGIAVACFILAFIFGRRPEKPRAES
jgi:Na+/phosphate symporter